MDTDRPYEPPDPGASATPEPPHSPPPTPPPTPPVGPQSGPPPVPPPVPPASGPTAGMPPAPPPEAYAKPTPAFNLAEDWPAIAVMVAGAAAVGMMFPDWSISKLFNQEEGVNGFNRDLMPAAPIMLVILLAAVVAIAGYSLLTRRPRWLVLAAVPAFTALMVVIVMMTTLSEIGDSILGSIPGGSFELGAGAYLCLVFTLLALCASLYPLLMMLRNPTMSNALGSSRAGGEWSATGTATRAAASKRPAPPKPPEFPHAEGD